MVDVGFSSIVLDDSRTIVAAPSTRRGIRLVDHTSERALAIWLAACSVAFGFAAMSSSEPWLHFAAATFAIGGWLIASHVSWNSYRDTLAPVLVLGGLLLIRMTVPLVLLWSRGWDIQQYPLFSQMRLTPDSWAQGHTLAMLGLDGLVTGWLLTSDTRARRPRIWLRTGGPLFSTAAICFGAAGLAAFVGSNASLSEVAVSGGFRGVDVQVGTGKFFYIALASITGSVFLGTFLLNRYGSVIAGLIPPVLVGSAYFVLGGRARAITPTIAYLVVAYYWRRRFATRRRPLRNVILLVLLTLAAVWFGNLGQEYRGGLGLEALTRSFSTLGNYLNNTLIIDFGQLHSLAGISMLPQGSFRGASFLQAITWPFSNILGMQAPNAGAFVIRELVGPQSRAWGLQSTLIGDAYLNFGVIAIPLTTCVLGAVLKLAYTATLRGSLPVVVYGLLLTYSARVFLESVDKWPEMLVVLLVAGAIALGERLLVRETENADIPVTSGR